MKLTVLGRYSPYPPPGGACSGYLIQHDGQVLLLDCGSGITSRLQNHIDFCDLQWIILSHLHPDHISDLFVLRHALQFAPTCRDAPPEVEVFAPGEPAGEFVRLSYKDILLAKPTIPEDLLHLGPFSVRFAPTRHPIESLAVRLTTNSGTMVYTGDTALCQEVIDIAGEADVLLAEATLKEPPQDVQQRRHMTAREAGNLAEMAGVKKLLLTHISPYSEPGEIKTAAKTQTSIPVEVVDEQTEYLICS